MSVATYKIGEAERPPIRHDNGFLDVCTPQQADVKQILLLGLGELAYSGASKIKGRELADALAAYNHFLHGNGNDRTFSYERYVAMDPGGKETLKSAVADAKAGVELLDSLHFAASPEARFSVTGTAIPCGHSPGFPYPQTENWQKAIGAHWVWLSARVVARTQGALRQYDAELTLHAEDRYNFNPGAHDIKTGLADSWNGELECSSLGMQYMNYATLVTPLRWSATAAAATGREYIVKPGDTLSRIAQSIYGDAQQWRRLHAANAATIPDPNRIFPGQRIVVPA